MGQNKRMQDHAVVCILVSVMFLSMNDSFTNKFSASSIILSTKTDLGIRLYGPKNFIYELGLTLCVQMFLEVCKFL